MTPVELPINQDPPDPSLRGCAPGYVENRELLPVDDEGKKGQALSVKGSKIDF